MPKLPIVLILTSRTGGGHVSLAEALRDYLVQEYHVELDENLLPPFVPWHYALLSRCAPWLWSREFQWTNTPKRAQYLHRLLLPLIAPRLTAILRTRQPVCVISTHPLLSNAVACVLRRQAQHIPFVLLFSDPQHLHATWLTERQPEAVLAPTLETYQQASEVGFPGPSLHAIGWPVRQQFSQIGEISREDRLKELNYRWNWQLDPHRLTIFLQGGGDGGVNVQKTLHYLLKTSDAVQIILATGTNRRLYAISQGKANLYPLPWTREMAPVMAAADVIMGKAGPNTLFEAVALEKPFIATSYLPGQEEGNLEFLRRYHLGWVALEQEVLCTLVANLAADRLMLHDMGKWIRIYHQRNIEANRGLLPIIRSLTAGGTRHYNLMSPDNTFGVSW